MKKHMLFFDIDGTLLDEKTGMVPQSTVNALHQARERGHWIFICTGRCKAIWPEDILSIGFDGVVGGCGTHIYYEGKEIFHATLDSKLQREIADDLVRFHIDGALEGSRYTYFREDMWIPEVIRIYNGNGNISADSLKSWKDELDFDKMALWFDKTSNMDAFKEKYENRFDFIERDPTFYEIVPKGCSKGTGIAFLCEHLGVDRADTIGFGDSTNDLPMLLYTGVSVAMGSGNPDIFSSVDYVTAPVMGDGIEKALKKYNIIE
jgi:hypothetical protein